MAKLTGMITLLAVLGALTIPIRADATPICEDLLQECIDDAESEYIACIQEPQPVHYCEGEYQSARDICDAEFHACEEEQTLCTPCSASNYTQNEAYCGDPPIYDACGCCERENSPIVIDLAGDGFDFSAASGGVRFGIAGLAPRKWVGWPVVDDDVWLAWDRNGNGFIGDARELFGTATACAYGPCENGYEALKELDGNQDGRFDSLDPVFFNLRVWADANRNGISEASELRTLVAAGIASIDLDYRESRRRDRWGNQFRYGARVQMVDGRKRWSVDVFPVTAPLGLNFPRMRCGTAWK